MSGRFSLSRGFQDFGLAPSGKESPPLPPSKTVVLETGVFELSGADLYYDPPFIHELESGEFVLEGGDVQWALVTSTRTEVSLLNEYLIVQLETFTPVELSLLNEYLVIEG